jgi:hypothetical protein
MSPEQIAQYLAAGGEPQALPAIIAAAKAAQPATPSPAAGPPIPHNLPSPGGQGIDASLAALQRAADPTSRLQTFSHPKDKPVHGRGDFDGEYAITVISTGIEPTRKGQRIFKVVLGVDESSNLLVPVGTRREHALFQWVDAAVSETRGLLQKLFEANGGSGSWADPYNAAGLQFYHDCTGEKNGAAGLRFRLSISTEPQQGNASKFFTHYRYGEQLAPGQVLGITPSAAPAVAAPMPAPSIQVVAPVAAAAPSGYPPRPPGYPASLPWPPV